VTWPRTSTTSSSSCAPATYGNADALHVGTHRRDRLRLAAEKKSWTNLDAEIDPEDLRGADPFEEGDMGLLSDVALAEAVAGGSSRTKTDLYAERQLGRIAR